MEERKVKRIGRIAKGEVVVAQVLAEDLQDLYEKMLEIKDDAMRSYEIWEEDKNEETAREKELLGTKMMKAKFDLWDAIHERYGYWNSGIGIRDGYALVTMPSKEHPFKRFMRNFMDQGPDFGMDDE